MPPSWAPPDINIMPGESCAQPIYDDFIEVLRRDMSHVACRHRPQVIFLHPVHVQQCSDTLHRYCVEDWSLSPLPPLCANNPLCCFMRPPPPGYLGSDPLKLNIINLSNSFWLVVSCVVLCSAMLHRFHNQFSQSRRRPLLGPSLGWKCLLALVLSHLRHYAKQTLIPTPLS